ncbi:MULTISPECIES: hypothetical protein [unclassified Mesorhizobium]|uniref:hypothetical protein n=1 Tax=unclassified Mesorhizobium TaxID=325217 RepID=UPI0003CE015C|nr:MULTISPECIES: hypothetical protein [unclassified Mesorhizobium]ESW79315.1 hypothetical protein X773_17890 [Mesorhizobium sp. LSJC285A00]ESX99741.1 hypothetical protein X755_12275 [Mesorhizobium sp. LNJC405B00]ESZ03123.1 hypothetical protein X736_26765 [Mesorhizobium sp. L2C089B000]WJI50646.1 hypothetical protein NLY44_29880 [Mesorhizobium sp. C089B]
MQAKVAAAPAALELIAQIVAEHGPVLFHQSEQGRRRCNLYLPTMILNLLIALVISLTVLIRTFGLIASRTRRDTWSRGFACTDAAAVSPP